jgi:hypothetical protein
MLRVWQAKSAKLATSKNHCEERSDEATGKYTQQVSQGFFVQYMVTS